MISMDVVCKCTLHLNRVLRQYREVCCPNPRGYVPLAIQLQGIKANKAICADTVALMTRFLQCFRLAEFNLAARCCKDYARMDLFSIDESGIRYDLRNDHIILWNDEHERSSNVVMSLSKFGQHARWEETDIEELGDPEGEGDLDAEWEQRIRQCLSSFDTDEYRPDGPDAQMVDLDVYFEDDGLSSGR